MTDWVAWHEPYADETSDLSRRRRSVQEQIRFVLDSRPGQPLRIVSACAGEGRDVLEVVAERDDRSRADIVLLETHPELAASAARLAMDYGLERVDVRTLDAGITDSYVGAVPADLVVMCGVFGNLTDDDVRRTIGVLPRLCRAGASVVWTRGRFATGDLTPMIRAWFAECGFTEIALDAPSDSKYRVGHHRYVGVQEPLATGPRFFTFTR